MKVLILGVDGMIGHKIAHYLEDHFDLTGTSRKKLSGLDTTFIIKKSYNNYIGSLKNIITNIQIDFFSNLPGLQVYTAHNLKYKKKLYPYQGICLENQYYPDTPNKKKFPSTLIKPNKLYKCFVKIKFN